MACMAVVTGISTTVATGTLVVSMVSQQVQAAGAISADGKVYTYSGNDNSNINLSTLNATYENLEKVVFDMTGNGNSNWFGNTSGYTGLIQIGADVYNEAQGLLLNNGNASTYEISNTVVGAGTLKKTGAGTNMVLLFSGDVTGYTGKIELSASAAFTLQAGKEGVTAAATTESKGALGTGSISFTSNNNTLKFAYDAGAAPVYVTNNITRTSSNTSRVNLTGGADYIFTKGCKIDQFTMDGGSVNFTSGNANIYNATLTGDVTIGGKATPDGWDQTNFRNLNAGGSLTVTGQISLGGTVTLVDTVTNNGTVYLKLDDGLSIDLSGLTAEVSGSGKGASATYTLFDGGTVTGTAAGVEVDLTALSSAEIASVLTGIETSGKEWTFADGKLTYTILASDLMWSTAGSLDWAVGTEFDGGVAFSNDDNVIFAADLGDVVANITEDIVVSQLTVKGGTDLVISGTETISITKAVFEEGSGLTIDADQVMTWAPTTMEGTPTLTVKGELTLENGNFNSSDVLVDGGTLNVKGKDASGAYFAGDLTLDNGGVLNITEGNDLFNYNDANRIEILNGAEMKLNATRVSLQAVDELILNGGKITGTGDGYGAVDFFENCTLQSDGESSIIAPIRIRNGGQTTTLQVNSGSLTISETTANGNLDKTGSGALVVTGNLGHGGSTKVSAGSLQFAGSSTANHVILAGGAMDVTATGVASITELSGAGSISVAEGGKLTLTTVTVDGEDAITLTGAATAGDGFTKIGTGSLTLAALNIGGSFNMNGHEGQLNIGSVAFSEGATLVYGAGDVVSLAAPVSAVTLNVFGVASSLGEGVNTGFIYTDGMDLAALQDLLTVEGVDDFTLSAKDGYVILTSTATINSEWDINWGATLATAPAEVKTGGVGSLASGTDGSLKLYELYGNTTYTPSEGVVAISLTGEGDANAVIIGGNDAHTDNSVGTVTTDVWIEANEGTYKAIVGGNYANNWGGGSRADFVGDTHIKIDGATVGTVMGGNYKDGQGATFTGNSYISVFSGNVTGAIVGAGVTAHDNSPRFIGNTNIFVYTALEAGSSQMHSEPADMVIGGFAWGTNVAGTYTLDGNTNITVDLNEYTGEATFNKHIVGVNYSGTENLKNVLTGSSNIVMDLGSASLGSGIKVIGGSWVDAGNSDTNSTNISIKSGTFVAPIVGGSWIAMHDANHKLGTSTINISGGAVKGNVFGANRMAGGSSTLIVGDVNILVNGEAAVSADIFGGNCIETQDQAGVTASIDSVTITVEGDATVTGDIIGGNYCDRNNNSNSTSIKTGEITINLNEGAVKGNVYAGGYASGNAVQTVNDASVNISSTVELAAGKTISGGFAGGNAAAGVIANLTTLGLADAVEYTNLAGVNFVDFNAVSLGEGTKVTFADFGALNKELTVTGKGTMTVANAAMQLDKVTLSGATLKADFGITSTTALSIKMTEPSQLISRAGKDLTLAALEIDMTGASSTTPYVDIDGELKCISKVNITLTGVADLAPGEYKLISADSIGLTAADLNVVLDAEAPEGMEYVVEIVGSKLIFRSAFLSEWVWEGDANGEGTVWSSDADGWKAGSGSPDGQDVYFTAAGEGVVTVSGTVTPANMNVTGGEYTFEAENENASIQLGADGLLSISEGATVNMAMDNADLGGATVLGGTLKLQSDNAIGDSALQFNGGTLVYDTLTDDEGNKTHISTDLSQQSSLAADYNGPVKIEVTDAENTVTWLKESKDVANSGVDTILASGIEKTGAGEMTVQWQYGTSTNNGAIDVKEGSLNYIAKVTQGAKLTMAGGINVAGGADFHIESDAFATGDNASTIWVTISGNITGAGNVSIGSSAVKNGRYFLSGDNSSFAGTLTLYGNGVTDGFNRVGFEDAAAFGGAASTVQINGRGFFFNPKEITAASAVTVIGDSVGNVLDGSTNQKITFTGAWTVAEDAAFGSTAAGPNISYTVTLAGDISAFEGTLRTRSNNTWVLGGAGVDGSGSVDMAAVTGDGKLKVQYGADTVLNTVVADSVAVQQSGAGKLIIASENTTTGKLTVDADSEVQLGAADVAGSWAGSTLEGAGKMTLVNGALTGLTTKADSATLAVETTEATVTTFAGGSSAGTVVDLTGSDASLLDSIKLAEGSTLIVDDALTVGGEGNTTLDMSFTTDNIGASAEGLTSMIQGGDLTIAGTEGVNLNMNNADVLTALNNIGEGDLYLQLTDGALATADGVDINAVIAPDLLGLGVRAQLTEEGKTGGYVVINGDISGVYFTDNQEGSSADTADTVKVADSSLAIFGAVVINKGDTLEVAADTIINNLNGQEDGNLVVKGGSDVVLNNKQLDTGVEGYDPMGAANALGGDLTGEEGSTITMQGEGGSLAVGGDVNVDTFTVVEGALDVAGSLTADAFTLQSGSLTVGGALTADSLVVESGSLTAEGDSEVADLTIAEGSAMEVGAGKSLALTDADISGELSGTASKMTIGGAVSVDGTVSGFAATLADGSSLELGGTVDVTDLQGSDATIKGTGGILNVGGGSFGGALSGAGALTNNGAFTLDNAKGSEGWDVTNNGSMVIDITDSGNITLGALALGAGSDTTLLFNSDNGTDGLLTLQNLIVEDTADITLQTTGVGQIAANEYKIGEVTDWAGGEAELAVEFSGTAFSQLDKINSYIYVNENGEIILNAVKSTVNELAHAATQPNAAAGAELLWNAEAPVGGELEDVYNTVNELIAAGAVSEANEAMAAVAGASTASLGMALSGDVDRQLRAIRNRTTTMGVNQTVVNEDMPYFNAWVNAEGNMGELDKDGLAAGYQLDSWGGTVGFDVDVNPYLTLGLAVTAMYGDLTVDGPDMLEGDLDTYYVSAFARYSKRAWTHTFVGTIGMMDGSYERTVNHAGGSYKAEGDTDGMAFGLMYEVGRVLSMGEDTDACWQPVFNVAYRHTSVGGYKEEGSDAALDVADQTLDTITLGAGARMQAVVGENLYNRTSVLELRALAKFDIGDRASEADVALINGTGRGTVESAELGAFGVEVGAGLSVPLGAESGTLFIDASAELRSGYSNVNGTVGWRINF